MMSKHVGIIERAFELAGRLANVEAIRTQLRREGYWDVDAHLTGRKIRSDLVKIIREGRRSPDAVVTGTGAHIEGIQS